MFVKKSKRHVETHAIKTLNLVSALSKVTLKWTGRVKNFTKCQLGSNLMVVIHLTGVIRLDLDSIPTVGASVGKVGF